MSLSKLTKQHPPQEGLKRYLLTKKKIAGSGLQSNIHHKKD